MTDKVELIRKKIEEERVRWQKMYEKSEPAENMTFAYCARKNICKELLSFIDSLQEDSIEYNPFDDFRHSDSEEPVIEDLEEEYNNYIDIHDGEWTKDDYIAFAKHFAEWGKNHHEPDLEWKSMSLQEKKELIASLSKDIPQNPANEDLEKEINRQILHWDVYCGALRCDENPAYLSNIKELARHFANWQKAQLLKDAIDAVVSEDLTGSPRVIVGVPNEFRRKDKVKIVVIKEEE